jgi:solute carrier family 13 (sodium-dependent dicarboxylate transporter), member 2/3/5
LLVKQIARILGPVLFVIVLFLPHASVDEPSWRVLAVAVWMLTWWLTETVNLAVTALLPLVLLPLLGVMPLKDVTPNYANPLVYLFFGGFVLALAIEKWNLHTRIALHIIKFTGTSTMRIFLGFMVATAFLSMWISNTATAVMMLPIALSVVDLIDAEKKTKLAVLMLIGLAWSANIGGMATLIGTPPNLVLAGFMKEELNREIYFSEWIVFGLPLAIALLAFAYLLLGMLMPRTQRQRSSGQAAVMIDDEVKKLGPLSVGEKRVLIVFVLTAFAWIFRKQLVSLTGLEELSDTVIALLAGIMLFVLPAGEGNNKRLLIWKDTQRLEWGILILFGGGLALASAIQASTWVTRIGDGIASMGVNNILLLVLVITFLGVFLTEIISNMALVTALLPLIVAIAAGSNTEFFNLALPLTLGASCASMLPMATPPNAIVFGSGRLTVATMAKYGFWMNLISIAAIVLLMYIFQYFT